MKRWQPPGGSSSWTGDADDSMELVPKLIATDINGGEFDFRSFSAGFQAGRIDEQLAVADKVHAQTITVVVLTELVEQIHLIAMSHGFPFYTIDEDESMPEWVWMTVRRPLKANEMPPCKASDEFE